MAAATGYLLDTNILVSLIRGNALGRHIDVTYGLSAALARCTISVVTVGEMLSLARQFGWGSAKTDALKAILDELVWVGIDSDEVLDAYGEIDHYSETVGRPMGKNDVWIAATARATKVMLLTTDKSITWKAVTSTESGSTRCRTTRREGVAGPPGWSLGAMRGGGRRAVQSPAREGILSHPR